MLVRPSGVLGSWSRSARSCPEVPGAVAVSQLPFRQGVRLAVDVGSVRIGVARSDPGGVLATPLTVLASGPVAKAALARADLARLVVSEGAIEVVVGLPTSLSGREGAAAAGAREFAADLAGRLAPIPVRLVDERFTTTEAHGALRRGGKDARARRQVVDSAAAAVLLQAALDAERATGRPAGQLVPVREERLTRDERPARDGVAG
jgi:putative holliday junction resolvase